LKLAQIFGEVLEGRKKNRMAEREGFEPSVAL
jgi:hypothetical protein